MQRLHTRVAGVAGAVIAVLAVTGCSGGTPTVDHDKLARTVSDRLTKTVGQRPDSVTCPDDLEGKKGSSTRCSLKAGGETYGVTVTTTAVKDKNVAFHIQVDDKPKS